MTDNTFNNTNSTYDYDRYYGLNVVDPQGDKVGEVGQVYLDDQTGRPEWVTVKTGLFGLKETFVPLQGETVEGDSIRVPYTKEQIKGAPSIDPEGHISEAEEAELYRYYSVSDQRTDRDYSQRHYAATDTTGYPGDVADRKVDTTVADGTQAGYPADVVDREQRTDRVADDKLADTKDGVVAHEERLNVGTERVEAGRVRIRKHVIHEQQSVQVPVTREEVRVERTPLNETRAAGDVDFKDGVQEQEIVLHEERPVVSKETVATERVNVGTEQVTENQTVSADLAKERIEVETDGVRTDVDGVRDGVRDDRSFTDKVKDKLDRDNDGKIG